MAVLTNRDHDIYKVWFMPAGSSVEQANRHPVEEVDDNLELLVEYENRGDEVIEMRLIRDASEAGEVLYRNRRYA